MTDFGNILIPPARSPVLQPTDAQTLNYSVSPKSNSYDSFHLDARDNDVEYMPTGSPEWIERDFDEDQRGDSDDDVEDFSLEDSLVTVEGLPNETIKMDAKTYKTPEFAAQVLKLLRDDYELPGWENLPYDLPPQLLKIQKLSGALTNAVFFVSIPGETFEISHTEIEELNLDGIVLHDRDRTETETTKSNGRLTPTQNTHKSEEIPSNSTVMHIEAPTILLRVYGPSSSSLISRKTEIHVLYTLSTEYAIGPKILGTFTNGRVEEYFKSRALVKEEMRDPLITRAVGRRMRDMHRVDLRRMELPGGPEPGPQKAREIKRHRRPSMDPSKNSIYSSASSAESVFTFNTSMYSASDSAGSAVDLSCESFEGAPMVSSPLLLPVRRGSFETPSDPKKRAKSLKAANAKYKPDRLVVWENITRWTREARGVLAVLDEAAGMKGFSQYLETMEQKVKELLQDLEKEGKDGYIPPLTSPSLTFSLREEMNLPLFEQQVKLYRAWVREWEKNEGRSKRVFCHNDTQYGNLLIQEDGKAPQAGKPPVIHCIDFEYSGPNARGYDIANHFVEFCADYHHPTHPFFVDLDKYPTKEERSRFFRAYTGADGGRNQDASPEEQSKFEERISHLEEEVKVWQPASHASWAVWGIVQAREDITSQVEVWKAKCARRTSSSEGLAKGIEEISSTDAAESAEEPEKAFEFDFDYLSYALCRMRGFRKELAELGIMA